MRKTLYALTTALLLAAPVLGQDTLFYVDRCEVIELHYKVPFLGLGSPQFQNDTSYVIYQQPVRVQIKGMTLTIAGLGKWTIKSTDRKTQQHGSDGATLWLQYNLDNNQYAVIWDGNFMFEVKPSKRLTRNYTCRMIVSPSANELR